MLQRDKNVKKAPDIRRMLDRRLSLWENGKFLELIAEAENCNRKLSKSSGNISDEQAYKTFSFSHVRQNS